MIRRHVRTWLLLIVALVLPMAGYLYVGSVIYDDAGARWHRGREPHDTVERVELSALPPDKGALIPPFVQAIRAGKDMSAETQHELDVVSACLAADRALATGEQVEVTYV